MRCPRVASTISLIAAVLLALGCGTAGSVRSTMVMAPSAKVAQAPGGVAFTESVTMAGTTGEASGGSPARTAALEAPAPSPPAAPADGTAATSPHKPPVATDAHDAAMLVYTARFTMAVYQVDPAMDAVERASTELGGYLAVRSDREITVRVPRARFREAVAEIEKVGDVLHRNISAEDVTDEFVDLEVRIRNARAMRDRLARLLEQASVKDALEIEKQLARVTEELERMEGRIKLLRQKIAYSTLTVAFEPRGAASVRDVAVRLPFGWLGDLGLNHLLNLHE